MTFGMEPALEPLARLTLVLRVQAIAKMGEYFGKRVGLSERDIAIITKGIERKLVSRVEVLLYDSIGTCKGLVFFDVNWRKHEVIIRTDNTAQSVNVDLSRPIEDQIDKALAQFIDYISAQIRLRRVTRRYVIFSWRGGADDGADALRTEYGLVSVSPETQEDLRRLHAARGIATVGQNLGESSVGMSFPSMY